MLSEICGGFFKDYGWFRAFVLLGGIWVYFGGRKA